MDWKLLGFTGLDLNKDKCNVQHESCEFVLVFGQTLYIHSDGLVIK